MFCLTWETILASDRGRKRERVCTGAHFNDTVLCLLSSLFTASGRGEKQRKKEKKEEWKEWRRGLDD